MTGLEPLINIGAIGAVLAWFMFRFEAKLVEVAEAIEKMNRAILILSMSNTHSESARQQAKALLDELDSRGDKKVRTDLRRIVKLFRNRIFWRIELGDILLLLAIGLVIWAIYNTNNSITSADDIRINSTTVGARTIPVVEVRACVTNQRTVLYKSEVRITKPATGDRKIIPGSLATIPSGSNNCKVESFDLAKTLPEMGDGDYSITVDVQISRDNDSLHNVVIIPVTVGE
jgi:hypothetical protein